jgi:putative ABC transport system ATP-binding protein
LPQPILIQACGLTRQDAKTNRLLLDHANLTLRAGDRVGLVGPTGCGKSSLLRAITKLDRCDSGEVLYRGESICKDAVPAFRRRVIYLPQRSAFVAGTVRENLERPFQLEASESQFDPERAEHWLNDLANAHGILDQSAESLSGGQQQIVALVRAIALEPQVLLLDEPTAALDPELTARFEQRVMSWQEECGDEPDAKHALVWTSHDADQIRRMTTRTVQMRDGVLATESEDG